jgi:hypothetical protein
MVLIVVIMTTTSSIAEDDEDDYYGDDEDDGYEYGGAVDYKDFYEDDEDEYSVEGFDLGDSFSDNNPIGGYSSVSVGSFYGDFGDYREDIDEYFYNFDGEVILATNLILTLSMNTITMRT